MKLFTQYNAAHQVLFDKFFRPSCPTEIELHAEIISLPGSGDFYSPEWHACVEGKIGILLKAIRKHPGEKLLWSDVDVQFFDFSATSLEELFVASGKDVLFQREAKNGIGDVNTGFFICTANKRMSDFLAEVATLLAASKNPNDQDAINQVLRTGPQLSWDVLPTDYYARTHGFPPPTHIALYHANRTIKKPSVPAKCEQLRRIDSMMRSRFGYLLGMLAEARSQGMQATFRSLLRHFILL